MEPRSGPATGELQPKGWLAGVFVSEAWRAHWRGSPHDITRSRTASSKQVRSHAWRRLRDDFRTMVRGKRIFTEYRPPTEANWQGAGVHADQRSPRRRHTREQ